MNNIDSLSALVAEIMGDSLVYTDRGNGCGGAGYEDSIDVANEIDKGEREDEGLTPVTEAEDAEAWDLARDAFRDLKLDPASIRIVLVGDRAEGDNGYQRIYAA